MKLSATDDPRSGATTHPDGQRRQEERFRGQVRLFERVLKLGAVTIVVLLGLVVYSSFKLLSVSGMVGNEIAVVVVAFVALGAGRFYLYRGAVERR